MRVKKQRIKFAKEENPLINNFKNYHLKNINNTADYLDKLIINLRDEEDKLTNVTYELCNEDGNVIKIDLKYLNPRITSGLHSCGEKIMVVGMNLQNMYSKGLEVYNKFDV